MLKMQALSIDQQTEQLRKQIVNRAKKNAHGEYGAHDNCRQVDGFFAGRPNYFAQLGAGLAHVLCNSIFSWGFSNHSSLFTKTNLQIQTPSSKTVSGLTFVTWSRDAKYASYPTGNTFSTRCALYHSFCFSRSYNSVVCIRCIRASRPSDFLSLPFTYTLRFHAGDNT